MIVYHEGYSTGGAEERVKRLMEDPMMLLIDTRKSPKSWRPGWSEDELRAQYGERYRPAGHVLGNKNFFKEHAPIDIIDIRTGVLGIRMYLNKGHDVILLCECSDIYEYDDDELICHRYRILQWIRQYMPDVQILDTYGVETKIVPELPGFKAWSICPPYPQIMCLREHMIDLGIPPKEVENRKYPVRHTGPVLLHSSKTFLEDDLDYWFDRFPRLEKLLPTDKSGYDLGYIVGIATMDGIVQESDDPWFFGPYGMCLKDIYPLRKAVPWRGALKLFDVPYYAVRDYLPAMYKRERVLA